MNLTAQIDTHALVLNQEFRLKHNRTFTEVQNASGLPVAKLNSSSLLLLQHVNGIHRMERLAERVNSLIPEQQRDIDAIRKAYKSLIKCGLIQLVPRDQVKGWIFARYLGRLGNHLFIHAVARSLAEELGFNVCLAPISGFPGTEGLGGSPLFQRIYDEEVSGQVLPSSTVENTEPRCILLKGYFQNYDFLKPHKEKIRKQWLYFDKKPMDKSHLVVHIRSDDVWQRFTSTGKCYQSGLPVSYYRNIIESTPWKKMTIVTSHADDPIAVRLAKVYRARIQSSSVLEDFQLIGSAKKIVMSASTFAWWAAWLSDADEIHFPTVEMWRPGRGIHAQSLWVDDEDRFTLHEPVLPGPWRGNAEDEIIMVDA